MHRKYIIVTLIAALLCSFQSPAWAAPFFSGSSINPRLITPPLDVKSEQWKAELEHIIATQKNISPEFIEKAGQKGTHPRIDVPSIILGFKRLDHPQTYSLLRKVNQTANATSDKLKEFWNTKRPYLMDKRVKLLTASRDNPAYPSGHTTSSYTLAHILGMLFPKKRAAFMKRAEKIAQHRILVGMHYPHDLRGGKELALLVVGGLLQNPRFKKKFAAAQQEIMRNQNNLK